VVEHTKDGVTCGVYVARDSSDKGPRQFLDEYNIC